MSSPRIAALAARTCLVALASLPCAAPLPVLAQACAAAGSPGGLFGGGVAAAAFGDASGPLAATLGARLGSDPVLRPLLDAPTSCAPPEPASREPSVPAVAAGNPVDLVSGAKYERAVDVHLPVGSAGASDPLDFVIARHYSSARVDASVLGPGWRHSFETRLAFEQARRGMQPAVLQADGRRVAFARRYRLAGGGVRRHAVRHDDGVLDEVPGNAAAAWVWRWRNGRQLVFDSVGRLVRVVTGDRDAIALRYGDDGRLAVVVDNRGHRVDFRYHVEPGREDEEAPARPRRARVEAAFAGRLAAMSLPGGGEVRYGYDREGRLAIVDHADGARVRYHYDDDRAPARLTGVTLPGGARSEYRYDERGRVSFSRAAGAREADALRFEYPGGGDRAARGGTRVRWGDDASSAALYEWRVGPDGVPMMESGAGAQCAACPPVGRRFGWTSAGELASIEHEGTRIEFVRDGRGRVRSAWLHRARTPSRELLAAVDWQEDPLLDLVARVRRPSVVPGRWHELEISYGGDGRALTIEEAGWSPAELDDAGRVRARGARAIARRAALRYADAGPAPRSLAAVEGPLAGSAWASSREGAAAGAAGAEEALAAWIGWARARSPGLDATAAFALAAGAARVDREPRAGLLTATTPAGRTVVWAFDDFDRVAIVRSPGAGTVRRAHDAAGRLVEETHEGAGGSQVRYDAIGRVAEFVVRDAAGTMVTTRYRYRGERLVAVEHPAQREEFEHDAAGRLRVRTVRIARPAGAPVVARVRYRYDEAGALAAREIDGGSTLRFRRDASGRVDAVLLAAGARGARTLVAGLAGVDAGPAGGEPRLGRIRYGNGVEGSFVRDPFGVGLRIRYSRAGAPRHGAALSASPGESGLPWEQSLRFDAHGNPVRSNEPGEVRTYAYDGAGRLVQAIATSTRGGRAWRYAWDADGSRLLAAEGAPEGDDAAAPGALALAPNGLAAARPLRHDAAGRVVGDGGRRYAWSPQGQLVEVRDGERVLAHYRYDHRGRRIARQTGDGETYFLHEGRRLVAELDASGRVEREYVWAGRLPVAVVERDRAGGARVAFVHWNHLGAPVLATDGAARVVWRAAYAPFGRATVRESGLRLALRLPGQYEDDETGLHHNDHRHYDPDRGRYLSPDPLGVAGGLDPHAYAAGSPLRYVDESGLALFAFDGTGNASPPPRLDDWSNVYKLSRAYAGGRVWYMSGVGTNDAASGIRGAGADAVLASSARARVDWMLAALDRAAADPASRGRGIDVDVIGFSRGAAMARDFANRVAQRAREGHFVALGSCVRLRFLGLWDTVAQFGLDGLANLAWKLAVPAEVAYAAQAVALNEHRTLFPAESILGGPGGGARIERGFVGAHADIGGSYAEGDLSDVALVWMREQAIAAGVPMFALSSEFARVTDPWLHDSTGGAAGDREFVYRNSIGLVVAAAPQRVARVEGLQWSGTARFVTRLPGAQPDAYGEPVLAGRVDMQAYSRWLAANYAFTVAGP